MIITLEVVVPSLQGHDTFQLFFLLLIFDSWSSWEKKSRFGKLHGKPKRKKKKKRTFAVDFTERNWIERIW